MRYLVVILALIPAAWGQNNLLLLGAGAGVSGGGATTSRVFNGSTQDLTNSGTAYLSGVTAFTIAFWMKSGSLTQTNTWMLTFGNAEIFGVIYGYSNTSSKANV